MALSRIASLAVAKPRWLLRSNKALRRLGETDVAVRRRVLFVDDMVPDPLFGAGYPRAFEIVRALVDDGYRVDHYPMVATRSESTRVEGLFGGAVRFHRARGQQGLHRLLRREGSMFDVIFISRPNPMRAFLDIGWQPDGGVPRPPVIYDAEAVLAPRERRRREIYSPAMSDREYSESLGDELGLMRGADAVTTVGPADASVVGSEFDIPTYVLSHAKTVRSTPPGRDGRSDILFVGRLTGVAEYSPNVDSVRFFVTDVMPELDRLIGTDYRLRLVGLVDSPDIDALASDRVVQHGVVEDLGALYDSCRVFVAPTRYAAGIPLKVIEAMSEGIPCVVTRLLAAQLDAEEPTLAIGDDANGVAQACARLYTDPVAWGDARDAGLSYVDDAFSPRMFRLRLTQLLDAVVAGSAT